MKKILLGITKCVGLLTTGMVASEWRYRGVPVTTQQRYFLSHLEGQEIELHNIGFNPIFVRKLNIQYKGEELYLSEYKEALKKEGKYVVDHKGWDLVQDGWRVLDGQGRGFLDLLPGFSIKLFKVKSTPPTAPDDDLKDRPSIEDMKIVSNDQVLIDPSTCLIIRYSIYLWPLPFAIPLKVIEKLN